MELLFDSSMELLLGSSSESSSFEEFFDLYEEVVSVGFSEAVPNSSSVSCTVVSCPA
jgi:hypothetical protein